MQKNKNWGIFDFCNQFLQTEDQLFTATLDLCHRLGSKNVIYAEIRFCPDLHIVKGLTPEQALLAVIKGMNITIRNLHHFTSNQYDHFLGFSAQSEVQGGIIICALR